MVRWLLATVMWLSFTTAFTQILDNSKGLAFTDYPFFNKDFIKASNIAEIRGSYTFKKQGDVMRRSDYVYVFTFDTLGRLSRHYETAKGDIVSDTIVRYYTYDGAGNLRMKRINEKRGFMSTYYTYDDAHRVVKEEIWRDIDTMHGLLAPDVERSILWNSETMKYETYDRQEKKRVYNSYGNQYVEVTSYFDSLGYLSAVNELYTITRDQYTAHYTYANKGWISSIRSIHNNETVSVSEVQFEYDQYGNLTARKEFRNGVFTTEYQIIYSGDTGMLSSILIREVSTNFISIIRFSEPLFRDQQVVH